MCSRLKLWNSSPDGGVAPTPFRRCAAHAPAKFLIRLTELRRYSIIGRRTISRTLSSSSPTNVCSISVTCPRLGPCPCCSQLRRYAAELGQQIGRAHV